MAEKMFYHPFKKIKPTDQTIWFHAASLGNIRPPVIEIKEEYPPIK
jgi:3-deoxy-D-manno-octulosonic-acid transferase